MNLRKEITETLSLRDVANLFPSYDVVRVWKARCGEEKPDGSFAGHTGWYYRARKRFQPADNPLRPIEAPTMLELIGKITVGAEVFTLNDICERDNALGEEE